MSKLNKNKITGLFFALIAIGLIFLSIQKMSSQDGDSIVIADTGSKISSEHQMENQEEGNPEQTEIIQELGKKTYEEESKVSATATENYFEYSLIIESEKITGIFQEGDSLYDSLLKMKEKGMIDFQEKNFSSLGSYIYSINNISENKRDGEYWIYYVNEDRAKVGVSNYFLKKKDEIRWQLENNTY